MREPSPFSSAILTATTLGRVLLVAAAATAVVVGFRARRHDEQPAARAAAPAYVCPMHPEVTSPAPGDCPICRMALEPAAARAAAPDHAASVTTASLPELRAFDAVSRTKRYETSLEMRLPAWAEDRESAVALAHLDEREALRAGEAGLFLPSRRPRDGVAQGIAVLLDSAAPVRWDGATALVRFHAAPGAALAPGETGSIKLAPRIRDGLVVRASAILRSPDGPYVLVASNDRRTFTKRPVEIGNVIYGYAAVMGGLREGELVAAAHTRALDAERRLGGGSVAP